MISNINNWQDIKRYRKKEKAKDIINKLAITLAIIFAIPMAMSLCINLNFSMYMLFAIMMVGIIWAIITQIWLS